MISVDMIFNKMENENTKKISRAVFSYLLGCADSPQEAKFIVNKIERLGIRINPGMYELYLALVEDYEEAIRVLKEIKKYKEIRKHKTKVSTLAYHNVMGTVKTLEQAEQVFNEIIDNKITPSLGTCMIFLKMQDTYEEAKKVFSEYILSDQYYRKRLEQVKVTDYNDSILMVYPIMLSKANNKNELDEVVYNLNRLNMPVDINYYNTLIPKAIEKPIQKTIISIEEHRDFIYEYIESFMNEPSKGKENVKKSLVSKRITRKTSTFDRNRIFVKELKELYNNCCQICNESLDLGDERYSEVHHIWPLHQEGEDVKENMIVLCPNHHVLFDRGALKIDLNSRKINMIDGSIDKIRNLKHTISEKNVNYHNNYIFNGKRNLILKDKGTKESIIRSGYKVILTNDRTKEEVAYQIPNKQDIIDMSFLDYKLLNGMRGELIDIENDRYLILQVIKNM